MPSSPSGRAKGTFYWNPSITIVEADNSVSQAAARFAFHDRNGNPVLDAGPSGWLADSPELGRRIGTLGGDGPVSVDPELASPYGHEFSSHLEQQIADDLSFRGSYVYKSARNLYGIVDMSRAFAYRISVAHTDLGADDVQGTADDQVLQLFDRLPDVPDDRQDVNPGRYGLPSPDGADNTVEVR